MRKRNTQEQKDEVELQIDDLPEGLPENLSQTERPTVRQRPSAATAILTAAFGSAVSRGDRRRLAHAQALAVTVQVPGAAWVKPTARFFKQAFGERWVVVARDGSNRSSHKSGVGSDEAAADLERGRCVVGIAADVGMLPRSLVVTADLAIRIEMPTGPVLRRAIARFTGRSPGDLADNHGLGLDLDEMVATFRPGRGARNIADSLAKAAATVSGAKSGDTLPSLSGAVEFGEARVWGMSLARDVDDFRAGRIEWSAMPRGLVLAGEPGTGKSLYARMLAEACSMPLLATSVADWFLRDSGYLHDVIRAAQTVFSQAATQAPAIIFLDEIDAIPNRSTLSEKNRDYWMPLVNFILTSLDNAIASTRRGVIVIGACNDAAALDPALVRPGRLERIITIERPNVEGTLNILSHHVRGEIARDQLADFAVLAERSTGAEIMQIVRHARQIARHAGRPLAIGDLTAAHMPPQDIPKDTLRRISLHEAGHAAAALAIPWGVLRRCVVSLRSGSAGHTLVEPDDDVIPTRQIVEDRVTMLLAGRAAERVLLSSESFGDQSDLAAATMFIATLHGSAGMAGSIVHLGEATQVVELLRSDQALRRRVERDLRRLESRADDLIRRHRDAVVAIASALGDKRHLSGDAVRAIFRGASPRTSHLK